MNKRKIDITDLKRKALKGKKYRTINVKYAIVLSYFKQKQLKDKDIFQVDFFPLIQDLLNQLNSLELLYKIQNEKSQPIEKIELPKQSFKLSTFNLKGLSNQFPIKELIQCIYAQKDQITNHPILGILKNKLMDFFKNLRKVYHDFCSCDGQTSVMENSQLKILYQLFKIQWSKIQQRAKLSAFQKLQKKVCRSLFFLGVIIQNNISRSIDEKQQIRKQELIEPGTKSQKKKNINTDMYYQINPAYSFYSAQLMSNFSISLKSQRSNQQSFNQKYENSQNSQKIYRKSKYNLWQKAQIKNLNFPVYPKSKQFIQQFQTQSQYQINLLSNEVQNRIIERAFIIQKINDGGSQSETQMRMTSHSNINPFYFQSYDYMNFNPQNSYNNYGYYPYSQMHYPYLQLSPNSSPVNQNSNRKTFDFINLVQTRKNTDRFTTGKKFS